MRDKGFLVGPHFVKTSGRQTLEEFSFRRRYFKGPVYTAVTCRPRSNYTLSYLVGLTLFLTVASLKSAKFIRNILSFLLLPMDGACSKSP